MMTGQTSFACREKTVIRTKTLDKEIQSILEPSLLLHTWRRNLGGGEAGGSEAQGHLWQQRLSKGSPGYGRLCLKNSKEEKCKGPGVLRSFNLTLL